MRSRTNSLTAVIALMLLSLTVVGPTSFAGVSQRSPQSPTITVDIANQNPDKPYRLGPEVRIKVIAKNETDQRITVAVVNEYAQNRPQLFKNGKLLAYPSGVAKLVRVRDDDPAYLGGMGKTDFIQIQPYSSRAIKVLNLNDWYGPLEPGSYRLTNRYRFTIGGPWSADSKALSFEIAR
jgi:hypothetical protein